MRRIDFLNLRSTYTELKNEIDTAINQVLDSGWYVLGKEVQSFEEDWASFCGAKYCAGLGSGLDALTISLKALSIGNNDEVIVPSNTYIATWLAVENVGAKIIPVEPNPEIFNIDPYKIEELITPNTKAIIPVHLYGQPADMNPILRLAKKYDLKVIEDAAQAHGTEYFGTRIGCHGNVVCWSFYPGKNLGAFGDAGAITTNNKEIYERIKVIRNYGSEKKYHNEIKGLNSRLDPIQAAVLKVKLKYLASWNERRQYISELYFKYLSNKHFQLPFVPEYSKSCWHQFIIRSKRREEIIEYLTSFGVSTLIHYPIPPHKQKAYLNNDFSNFSLNISETLSKELLSLPIGPHLDKEDCIKICRLLSEFK